MKLVAASVIAIGLGLAGIPASQAMPIAPIDQSTQSGIIRVAQGCGPGMHRGPAGYCRPLYTCPPGWHTGPFGRRCFRN